MLFHFAAISIDYDIYINDESKSSSVALAAPFDLGTSSLSVAMWIQFNSLETSGVFFTLYSVEWVDILQFTIVFKEILL